MHPTIHLCKALQLVYGGGIPVNCVAEALLMLHEGRLYQTPALKLAGCLQTI
jgi:hypothetical protein